MALSNKGSDKLGFHRTKQAAIFFADLISCCNPDCNQKSSELQYLGTVCKHAFCWDCINVFSRKRSPPACPMCFSALEIAKPVSANMYNNLSESLEKFSQLLVQYENAVKHSSTDKFKMPSHTQRLLNENFEDPLPRRTVDEFMSTQHHLDNSCPTTPIPFNVNENGLEDSRPNSNASANVTDPINNGMVTRSRSRSRSRSRASSSISLELDRLDEIADEESAAAAASSVNGDKPEVLNPGRPMMSSTQRNSAPFFLTQQQQATVVQTQQREPSVHVAPLPRMAKSFEFTKTATFTFAKNKEKKLADDPWQRAVMAKPISQPSSSGMTSSSSKGPVPSKTAVSNSSDTPKGRVKKKASGVVVTIKPDPDTSTSSIPERADGTVAGRRSLTRTGETLLLLTAVEDGDCERLTKLIESGHNVNESDPSLGTALYLAVQKGRLDMVRAIVEAGGLINAACGKECDTALHAAVKADDEKIVKYLLSKGASKVTKNIRRLTATDMAQECSPMRKLVQQYQHYPRQPSIPPPIPDKYYVMLDDSVSLTDRQKLSIKRILSLTTEEKDATHYVTALSITDGAYAANASLGLLRAMLSGLTVVSEQWLRDCLKRGKLVEDALKYEVQRLSVNEAPLVEGSVAKCRRSIHQLDPELFRGCKFYLPHPKITNFGTKAELSDLIRLGGGEVFSRPPTPNPSDPMPYHRSVGARSPYFVLYDPFLQVTPKLSMNPKYTMVTANWLFDCITHYRFVNPY